jgi:hypothetical protein
VTPEDFAKRRRSGIFWNLAAFIINALFAALLYAPSGRIWGVLFHCVFIIWHGYLLNRYLLWRGGKL